jgi:hypothetical protein
MEGKRRNFSCLWWAGIGLIAYCVLLTAFAGDLGFDADDWWIFSWPFWHSFPQSIAAYAQEALRPVEGVYWISLFEIFGFNKPAFHFFSLLLLATSSIIMGRCLQKAFPESRSFVVTAVLFSFFLPTVSPLTYIIMTDNSRLSLMFFWLSVSAYQAWTEKSAPWNYLPVPIVAYVLSFLTYESPSMLILIVPFLVHPIIKRNPIKLSTVNYFSRLSVGIFVSVMSALAIRFFLLNGGAVGQRHLFPPIELILSYLALLPFYIAAPFVSLPSEAWALFLSVGIACLAAFLFFRKEQIPAPTSQGLVNRLYEEYFFHKLSLGLGIFFLGMLPYQFAGYGSVTPTILDTVLAKFGIIPGGDTSWFNFNWASRIYSSASCGLAILVALLVTLPRNKWMKRVVNVSAAVSLFFFAAFQAGLSVDWKEAAKCRNELVKSLISQAPEVKSGTNFVFLDLECYCRRAAVIRRWAGLRELIRMLYADRSLGAYYLYSNSWAPPNRVFQKAIVFPNGFVTRGLAISNPVPHDSLLVFKRSGKNLVLLDKITSSDGTAPSGISWRGAGSIHSNLHLIEAWADQSDMGRRLSRNAWDSGLISSLNLGAIRSTYLFIKGWGFATRISKAQRVMPR